MQCGEHTLNWKVWHFLENLVSADCMNSNTALGPDFVALTQLFHPIFGDSDGGFRSVGSSETVLWYLFDLSDRRWRSK